MNWNSSVLRKSIYGALIVALMIPLYFLGQPATSDAKGRGSSGGELARLRAKYNLAQANLGEIDPASESMKLAMLGLRGVAAGVLWEKANEYKKTEDWDNLSATLNQITKLQPNFISVWEFQGHNLAYNVSAEFDDYRHRYHWVKKGIGFLIEGTGYNSKEPRLLQTIGMYFGLKIGRSDEYRQFRRLFRVDTDFHNELETGVTSVPMESAEARSRFDQQPDNWLVGRLWYVNAQTMVKTLDRPIRGKSPLIFYFERYKPLINYASAIEEEGHFGEAALVAWTEALREWNEYASENIPSSWGVTFQLGEFEKAKQKSQRLHAELLKLAPNAEKEIQDERKATFTEEERKICDLEVDEFFKSNPSEHEVELYEKVKIALEITDLDIAERAPTEKREEARSVARKLIAARTFRERIDRYRQQVNYNYWKTRCEAEQTEIATNASMHLYEAERDLEDAKLEDARKHFELAWDLWVQLFEKFPEMRDDLSSQDLRRPMINYLTMLGQLGEEVPKDFKLDWLLQEEVAPASVDYPPVVPGNTPPP